MNTPMLSIIALRDIHAPDPISWWPPAAGWWLLSAVLLMVVAITWSVWHWIQKNRLVKLALRELDALEADYQLHGNSQQLTMALSALLRRVCLAQACKLAGGGEVAGLTSESWLSFLEQNLEDKPFSNGPGRILLVAPFQRAEDMDHDGVIPELLTLCRTWIRCSPSLSSVF